MGRETRRRFRVATFSNEAVGQALIQHQNAVVEAAGIRLKRMHGLIVLRLDDDRDETVDAALDSARNKPN